jgi:ribosomal-protein-serine acetyltransferase
MFSLRIDDSTELRLLEDRNAMELFLLTDRNRAHLRQWLPWLDNITTVSDTKDFIRTSLAQFANNNGFQTGIWSEEKLVGMVGHHQIDWLNRITSLGYWLSAEMEGRGLVTKACQALIRNAFSDLGLNRIEISCATENKKSRAIPERLGFRQEGIIYQAEWLYDHFVDHVQYSLLSSMWKSNSGNSSD